MQPQMLIKQHKAGRRHHLEIWIVYLNRTRMLYEDHNNIVPGLWLLCSAAALSSTVSSPGKLACAVSFREGWKLQTFVLYSLLRGFIVQVQPHRCYRGHSAF